MKKFDDKSLAMMGTQGMYAKIWLRNHCLKCGRHGTKAFRNLVEKLLAKMR